MKTVRIPTVILLAVLGMTEAHAADHVVPTGETLPGTKKLTIEKPLDVVMVDGINRFAERALENSRQQRAEKWDRDYSDPDAYVRSIAENRKRFRTIIGAVDERSDNPQIEYPMAIEGVHTTKTPVYRSGPLVAFGVRWNVLDGVTGEGLLIQSRSVSPGAFVVALPDADWTPEMFVGRRTGASRQAELARRLARDGCLVLVPTLINRECTYSGHPDVRDTNQPHREFLYRMAFQMGRHMIGYEVQKVLAAVDAFESMNRHEDTELPIGVAGVGEGGLLALYSAAVDPRIDTALVSGYFDRREDVWKEPIYRNVWSLLAEFGDAEIASLIAPRSLVVEACRAPKVDGPPEATGNRRDFAAPGRLETPNVEAVRAEFKRAAIHYVNLGLRDRITLAVSGEHGQEPAGSDEALTAFLKHLEIDPGDLGDGGSAQISWKTVSGHRIDSEQRQKRQFDQLVAYTQKLLRESADVREEFWSKADRSSVEAWVKSAEFYRDYVREEMIGRLPEPTTPPNVRSRKILDKPDYVGYEVMLDVYPDVVAGGILLLPKDLEEGEQRPTVVCQHGLEGTPMDTITREGRAYRAYKAFSEQLVQRGFVVYAPQNPYRGEDRFRVIQRKSNPMQRSLFSYIIPQHRRTVDWLASLPWVDAERIGFYGLSYGGKTAVRVPPLLDDRYALSICSADFNEWIRKNVSIGNRYSYVYTKEYEMFEWNMGHVANYAELASLMTPRPFMVERGHHDGVAPDEWVAWEYAKVRRHYDLLGIGEKTEIEWFNGPHTINGEGTFEFLHRHLDWPRER